MDANSFLPLVRKFFEHDLATAAQCLENITDKEAAEVLVALPPPMAVRAIKHLQISYAAMVLKYCETWFLRELAPLLEPQFVASVLMHLPSDAREIMEGQPLSWTGNWTPRNFYNLLTL